MWVAVIGSIPFFGLLLLVWIIRRWGMSEALRGSDQAIQIFYYSQVLFAAFVQAIIAAVVAGRARRLGALLGLFAAFAAGCIITITILGLNSSLRYRRLNFSSITGINTNALVMPVLR